MSSEQALVPPEASKLIAAEPVRASGIIDRKQFQRWAAAIKDFNPLYFDASFARAHGYRDVVAPPLYIKYVTLGVADLDELRPDGTPGLGPAEITLPGCPRRMAGGEQWHFYLPAYHGDLITSARRINGIEEKHGRSGRFVLISSVSTYTNQDSVVVAEVRMSMIARP